MALAKFHKREKLSPIETQVGTALSGLQQTSADLKTPLESIVLTKVEEFQNTKAGKKASAPALLIYVHYQSYRVLLSVARKLIVELEKKLEHTVFFTAQRNIESKWVKEHRSQQRPRSRCLTYVYDALLDDLLLPSTLIGKRTRVRLDGSAFLRIQLDQNDRDFLEEKLELIAAIYQKLTTREVTFEFKEDKSFYSYKK